MHQEQKADALLTDSEKVEIRQLGLQFGLVSSQTSFVAAASTSGVSHHSSEPRPSIHLLSVSLFTISVLSILNSSSHLLCGTVSFVLHVLFSIVTISHLVDENKGVCQTQGPILSPESFKHEDYCHNCAMEG